MAGWRGKKKRNASAIGRSVRGRGRGGKQVRGTADEKKTRTEREREERECGGEERYTSKRQ